MSSHPVHGLAWDPVNVRVARIGCQDLGRANGRSGDEIGVTSDELCQRIEHQVGPMVERALPDRAEERVVDRHDGIAFAGGMGPGDFDTHLDVDEVVGGVGRRLQVHHAQGRAGGFGGQPLLDLRPRLAGTELDGDDAELGERVLNEVVGAAIEGTGMEDDLPGTNVRQERIGDRRHAAVEDEGGLGFIPQGEAILEDLQIRVVHPAVDESGLLALPQFLEAVGEGEEVLAGFGTRERERGGLEDRALHRALGPLRLVAVAHHEALRPQPMLVDGIPLVAHDRTSRSAIRH